MFSMWVNCDFIYRVVNYWNGHLEGNEVWAAKAGDFKREFDKNEAGRRAARAADVYAY